MNSNDLIVDPDIRIWVVLPLIAITFLTGITRHYMSALLSTRKFVRMQRVQDAHIIVRTRALCANSTYIPRSSFTMRRQFFNDHEKGFLTQKHEHATPNVLTDPIMIAEMVKGNIATVFPMVIIGGWVNWIFSGFIATKVPFPLTLSYKPMLQRGMELSDLDPSWVSSASWYFLNVFGLRGIYALLLGENNAADQNGQLGNEMLLGANGMAPDPKVAFKAEWEALEVVDHEWSLQDIESSIIKAKSGYIEHEPGSVMKM